MKLEQQHADVEGNRIGKAISVAKLRELLEEFDDVDLVTVNPTTHDFLLFTPREIPFAYISIMAETASRFPGASGILTNGEAIEE